MTTIYGGKGRGVNAKFLQSNSLSNLDSRYLLQTGGTLTGNLSISLSGAGGATVTTTSATALAGYNIIAGTQTWNLVGNQNTLNIYDSTFGGDVLTYTTGTNVDGGIGAWTFYNALFSINTVGKNVDIDVVYSVDANHAVGITAYHGTVGSNVSKMLYFNATQFYLLDSTCYGYSAANDGAVFMYTISGTAGKAGSWEIVGGGITFLDSNWSGGYPMLYTPSGTANTAGTWAFNGTGFTYNGSTFFMTSGGTITGTTTFSGSQVSISPTGAASLLYLTGNASTSNSANLVFKLGSTSVISFTVAASTPNYFSMWDYNYGSNCLTYQQNTSASTAGSWVFYGNARFYNNLTVSGTTTFTGTITFPSSTANTTAGATWTTGTPAFVAGQLAWEVNINGTLYYIPLFAA